MPEIKTPTSANSNPAGQRTKASNDLTAQKPVQLKLDSGDVDLQGLSSASKKADAKTLTVESLKKLNAQKTTADVRRILTYAPTLFGGSFNFFAGFTKAFLGEDNPLSKALDSLTNKVAGLSFMGLAAIGMKDAIDNKNLGLVLAQGSELVMPMVSSSDNLTMNRGVGIGGLTLFQEANKLGEGKAKYEKFSDSLDVLKKASLKFFEAFKANPIKAFVDYESGTSGIISGFITVLAPLLYKLADMAGSKELRKGFGVLRQVGGIILEFTSKLNWDNLLKGKYALFGSGGLLTISSVLNAIKEFAPQRMHKGIENITQAVNLVGRQGHVQALNNGELELTEKVDVKLSELPMNIFNAIIGRTNKQTAAAPVIGEALAETNVQTKNENLVSSNRSNSFSRSSFAPRANARTSEAPVMSSGTGQDGVKPNTVTDRSVSLHQQTPSGKDSRAEKAVVSYSKTNSVKPSADIKLTSPRKTPFKSSRKTAAMKSAPVFHSNLKSHFKTANSSGSKRTDNKVSSKLQKI